MKKGALPSKVENLIRLVIRGRQHGVAHGFIIVFEEYYGRRGVILYPERDSISNRFTHSWEFWPTRCERIVTSQNSNKSSSSQI